MFSLPSNIQNTSGRINSHRFIDFLPGGNDPNSVSGLEFVLIDGLAESCVEFEIFCLQAVGETMDSDTCFKF